MPELEKKILEDENPSTPKGRAPASRLGSLTKFKGELTCQEDVIVEGEFQGKIDSLNHSIFIEKKASAKAEIHGKNITVLGHVSGNIFAANKIVIGKGAVMIGDLSASCISIEEGAQFKGTIKMLPKAR